jgi:non-ribosomal peptide synthetase component F
LASDNGKYDFVIFGPYLFTYTRYSGLRGTDLKPHSETPLNSLPALPGFVQAGLAYVPIDPSYPRDRVTYMLTDSRAPVLLTSQVQC